MSDVIFSFTLNGPAVFEHCHVSSAVRVNITVTNKGGAGFTADAATSLCLLRELVLYLLVHPLIKLGVHSVSHQSAVTHDNQSVQWTLSAHISPIYMGYRGQHRLSEKRFSVFFLLHFNHEKFEIFC